MAGSCKAYSEVARRCPTVVGAAYSQWLKVAQSVQVQRLAPGPVVGVMAARLCLPRAVGAVGFGHALCRDQRKRWAQMSEQRPAFFSRLPLVSCRAWRRR
eukprot:COSAG01_NODE_39911_length_470_cov_1.425876_1_plen_99_part_01